MELQYVKQVLLRRKEQEYEELLRYWETRPPFTDENSIPDVPKVNKKDYEEIIVPNIIRCGGIPKKDLIAGETYIGSCRNAYEAVWDGERFTYTRSKFGYTYPEKINHFEDDNGFDLFVPFARKK